MKYKNKGRLITGAPGKTSQLRAGFVMEEFLKVGGLEGDFVSET